MSEGDLQTIIVPKTVAPTRAAATKIAKRHGKVRTSRETKQSWRFRQRPPGDFIKSSFRTKHLPDGVALVYGMLRGAKKNPEIRSDIRYMWKMDPAIARSQSAYELARVAAEIDGHPFESSTIRSHLVGKVAAKARRLGMTCQGKGERFPTAAHDESCFKEVLRHPTGPQVELFERNPSPRRQILKSPTQMPDPGPSAWLGELLEWKWKNGKDSFMWEESKENWMFIWSPKYKAIIGVKRPKKMKKQSKVSRSGGGAKMFERFASRQAKTTNEIEIPDVKLIKLGKAEHIIYRSDKWNAVGKTTDYIHEFGSGVHLYCGPNLRNPEVFLCFGGKLTCTERGLVN